MTDQDQPVEANDVPVVIYVPGLGSAVANNADRVADVVARAADVLDKGRFDTRTSSEVAAPRGLTVGKTVVDGAGNPRLQFFQYDYVFGSLILFEAMNPRITARLSEKPVEAVASLAS